MNVPPVSNPRWREIVQGTVKVELCCLATKLLLTRIVAQANLDPATIDSGVDELRTLFLKNETMPKVQYDLEQIFR